jgi:predicted TIM-barrel fold metal-dependent hydrolase
MSEHERYAGRIVDCHHHVWRQQDMPWLSGPMVPRIFGPYEPIKRDYPIEEYVADATSAGISRAVYVQPNWPMDRVVEEVQWVEGLHARTGWPAAVVGSVDLFSDSAVEVMHEQKELSPLLRGTRLQLHWHEREEFRFASGPQAMKDATFRKNIAALPDLGWLFELQVFADQMADAAELVRENPETTFVLVHAGMLVDRDEATVRRWRTGMAELATLPNVMVKLTGQGTFVHDVDPELLRFVAAEVVQMFGSRRAMFGTNFPIEKIWTQLPALVAAWKDALAWLPEVDQTAIFAGNTERVYGLTPDA